LTLPPDNADHALIIGQALHTGLEKGVDAAVKEYFMAYTVITDRHIEEAMKLEYVIPKAAEMLPKGEHELKIENEHFKGFIDLITPNEDGTFDLYDFKYSNNVSNYKQSPQLHLYKYFWEKENPGKIIKNMYFLFVPKVSIKQKKTEDLFQFRKRIQSELDKQSPQLVKIEFNYEKVIQFLFQVQNVLEASEFPKEPSYLCKYCEYQNYCEKGADYMLLPNNQRRVIGETNKRKIWIYGAAFSGKTTMLDKAPDPFNLNTDGNIQFVTMPYIAIKDEVKVEGRMTKRTFAWDVFKDAINELEKKQNNFKTIIVDLLEDTREMCRVKMYADLGIQHESDSGFGKGWDIIKTEYLSTIRRLFNLDYENIIVISHEDISKDITKKNGQNITRIAPNIQDAIANKIAGMVDIVARVVVEDDESRTLNFKSNEVIFGGGRLKGIKQTTIPLTWDALMQVYDEANKNAEASNDETKADDSASNKTTGGRKGRTKKETPPTPDEPLNEENMTSDTTSEPVDQEAPETEKVPDPVNEKTDPVGSEPDAPVEEEPKTRRSRRTTESANEAPKDAPAAEPEKEAPKTRTRRKRGE
jgi:CRISPR/Cas system-associated exonuclease Cas4 (RecB family)